jgi:hypothetical protein
MTEFTAKFTAKNMTEIMAGFIAKNTGVYFRL